jgi:hypothetical protein
MNNMQSKKKIPAARKILYLIIGLISFYVFTILWRVSVVEYQLFGKSELIPMTIVQPKFNGASVTDSFGNGTYIINRHGKNVVIWKQKINGFQHIFGSALTAFELGDRPANFMFCTNEYMEAIFDPDGISERDFNDRRKDLFHNKTGRAIGIQVKKRGLSGKTAENELINLVLNEMERGKGYIPHHKDPVIKTIGTEEQLGCPGIPQKSLFDLLQFR